MRQRIRIWVQPKKPCCEIVSLQNCPDAYDNWVDIQFRNPPGPFRYPFILHVLRKRPPAVWLHVCSMARSPFEPDRASWLPSPPWGTLTLEGRCRTMWRTESSEDELGQRFHYGGETYPQASQPCGTEWDDWSQVSEIGRGNYQTYVNILFTNHTVLITSIRNVSPITKVIPLHSH